MTLADYQLTAEQVEYYTAVVGAEEGLHASELRRHYYRVAHVHLRTAREYFEEVERMERHLAELVTDGRLRASPRVQGMRDAFRARRVRFLWLAADHLCIALQMREAARVQVRRKAENRRNGE